MSSSQIKAIDKSSVHRITSGQVVVDLQTAVKELVENSLDAGSTNIEIRFRNHGLKSVEVIDNGSGIQEGDFESIGLKHHTSKLETYEDLTIVETFGFRGEALSSLCALCEKVTVTTSTKNTAPKGTCLELGKTGEVESRSVVARKTGTTVSINNLFSPLPVRRKEFERNAKREFSKALSLLYAYALVPCASEPGVRLSASNFSEKGQKTVQLQTPGTSSRRAALTALWGSKALDNVVDLNISFHIDVEKSVARRLQLLNQELPEATEIEVKGLVSNFAIGCGRANMDRQFFYVNGRPCNLPKVQKAFNEVYRTFNANQAPLIVADFILPTASCDINVSPDKRTILVHNEGNLISALKEALESTFSPSRSTFETTESQALTQSLLTPIVTARRRSERQTIPDEEAGSSSPLKVSTSSPPNGHQDAMHIDLAQPRREVESPPPDDDVVIDTTLSQWARQAITKPKPIPFISTTPSASSPVELVPTASPPVSSVEADSAIAPRGARKRNITHDEDDIAAVDIDAQPPLEHSALRHSELRPAKRRLLSREQTTLRLDSFALPGSQIASSAKLESETEEEDEEDPGANSENLGEDVEVLSSADSPNSNPADAAVEGEEDGGDRQVNPSRNTFLDASRLDTEEGESDEEDPASVLSSAHNSTLTLSSDLSKSTLSRPEIIRNSDGSAELSVRFDIDAVGKSWGKLVGLASTFEVNAARVTDPVAAVPSDASVLNSKDNAKAVDALSRVIDKVDFAEMEVIGQFNLGFIVCRRRKRNHGLVKTKSMDDLFIVDQHAADEKYNFETLQLTTKLQSQKLLRPRVLELTAADELVASENVQVLKDNGFEVNVLSESPGEGHGGSRLQLTAQPVSKNTVFDLKDLEELIHLLRDSSSGTMVRCSKARAMFASRACRKSVMVGMPLNHSQMLTVVRHMGTMDQPWNCPHGRPTMRHLADIRAMGAPLPRRRARDVDWAGFGN
ncbi:hypothetical protein DFP72DRAFT_604810 [Ephemerocybe angulata]|uniref:DNA mismatch repair protein PMS1 n=1 Tax=Ephemerocybe angulata TaxID=980116 RepID=A0A8H6LZ99_9AGAR|nr:hypothetical protein DFP72DRAFT_604810 [Tulosesus angulatus]